MSSHRTDDVHAADALATWVRKQTPDELGALVDSIWYIGQTAKDPALVEHASALMELGRDERPDASALASLAELLEHAAGRLKSAAGVLGTRPPKSA